MRYTAEHKARTRHRILTEASREIQEHGCDGVAVAVVMARAGLTHGGFYAHFESKDALLAAAIDHMFADRFAVRLSSMDGLPPAGALGQFIDRYVSMPHRDDIAHGCPVAGLVSEAGRLPPAAGARFVSGVDRLTGWIAVRLADLGRDDSETLATSVLAEAAGAVCIARIQPAPVAERILSASRRELRARIGLPPVRIMPSTARGPSAPTHAARTDPLPSCADSRTG